MGDHQHHVPCVHKAEEILDHRSPTKTASPDMTPAPEFRIEPARIWKVTNSLEVSAFADRK
jgi:hypothetical protein